jgi:hypothetical protein
MCAHKSSTVFLSISLLSLSIKTINIIGVCITCDVELAVELYEIRYLVHELALLDDAAEALLAEVAEANEDVHEHTRGDVLLQQ